MPELHKGAFVERIPTCLSHELVNTHNIRIRLATLNDAHDILAVYTPYVDTPITFEEYVPTYEEFRKRIAILLDDYPYLVAERDGKIVGYAYAHAQDERAAYDWNAELSIYLTPESASRGLGSLLYRALIDLLRAQGVKCAYARVTLPNAASERLHGAFGFELMGIQRNAGYTCEAWRDVAWYTLTLSAFTANPALRKAFPTVDAAVVHAIVDQANCTLGGFPRPKEEQPCNLNACLK